MAETIAVGFLLFVLVMFGAAIIYDKRAAQRNPSLATDRFAQRPMRSFYLHLAGVSHKNPDGTSRQKIIKECEEGDLLQFVREPSNSYDPNAIAVMLPAWGQIGYVKAENATELADQIDAGWTFRVKVDRILHKEGTRTRGITVKVDVLTTANGRK